MSFADIEIEVIRWAEARGIVKHSTPVAQARKTLEEAGELIQATAEVNVLKRLIQMAPELASHPAVIQLCNQSWHDMRDAYGDVLVTEVVGAAVADVDLTECFGESYQEIKGRKGHMVPGGFFVKDAA